MNPMGVNHLFNATPQARLGAPRQKKSPSLAARTTVNPYHKHATSKHSLFDALTFIVSEVVQDAQPVLYPFVQRARDTYVQPGYAYAWVVYKLQNNSFGRRGGVCRAGAIGIEAVTVVLISMASLEGVPIKSKTDSY